MTENIKEPTRAQGVIMFIILLLAYISFASNWLIGSSLSGQITHHFFAGKAVSSVVTEVVNYSITIARIFANFFAAYILIKLSPKKASILALFFLSFSFLAIFSPNYWIYIAARMIMALGGSMIMVYMNTVIAKFIPADKKIITSALTTGSYNMGAVIVGGSLYFLTDYLTHNDHWQYIMLGFSLLSLISFALWLAFSKDFQPNASNGSSEAIAKEYTYSDALKDKFVYLFSLGFGGFLFLYVISLASLPSKLEVLNFNPDFSKSIMLFIIPSSGIMGTLFSMYMGKKNFPRKPYLIIHGVLMISAILSGILVLPSSVLLSYILFGFAGFVMASQYSVYLNLPYELPDMNPQKITIMFGAFWALGYLVYTLLNFVWSLVLDHFGWDASLAFYILFSCLYIICILTFPETKPNKKK